MPSQEFEKVIKMLRSYPPSIDTTIEEHRELLEFAASLYPVAEDISCKPQKAGSVPAEWIVAPDAADDLAVLYLHGGGYVSGSINTHRELAARISRAAKARALIIEYRLAPEHPFPAALEDSMASYRWLVTEGFDPARIVIAGDSAGGGLVISTLIALRDEGEALPAASVCLSPWVDLEELGESMITKAEVDPIILREILIADAKAYLGNADPHTPLAAPLYADLTGLPPMLIQVGTSEVLFDDSTRLAERARDAGVDVILEPWEEMIHIWQFFASILPEGQEAIGRIGKFIRQHTL
ncbi:MAG: alpha/beta hydrolase [Thermodesulfobacteriota bacterium]|nr:alpha/beta hydrolase [Thermodesulfobacteriota bacterium]